jgi:hypothetical protein
MKTIKIFRNINKALCFIFCMVLLILVASIFCPVLSSLTFIAVDVLIMTGIIFVLSVVLGFILKMYF